MTAADALPASAKETLHRYLRIQRDALVGKLDGLSEYDIRRPLTPTGTNLLGLVKHVGSVQLGYLGDVMGRPADDVVAPWLDDDDNPDFDPDADMFATAEESRTYLLAFWAASCAHADATIDALDLDAPGTVWWWSEDRRDVSLHQVLVHLCVEVARHAGHADILREGLDGATGNRNEHPVDAEPEKWGEWVDRIDRAARKAADDA